MHSRSVPVLVEFSLVYSCMQGENPGVPAPERAACRQIDGVLLKSGGCLITERGVTSHKCSRLLYPLVHTAKCMLGEDKGLDVKLSLPPQS